MPRTRKNVGLEHGGDYGTVQLTADSMDPNKGGIPVANPGMVAEATPSPAPPAQCPLSYVISEPVYV